MNRNKSIIKNLSTILTVCCITLGYSWIFNIQSFNMIVMAIVLALPATACEIFEI